MTFAHSFELKRAFNKIVFSGKPLGLESVVFAFALGLFGLGFSLIILWAELILKRLKKVIRRGNFGVDQTGTSTRLRGDRVPNIW